MVGVGLVSEAHARDVSQDVALGVLLLPSPSETTSVDTLRSLLLSHMRPALPPCFAFVTKEG